MAQPESESPASDLSAENASNPSATEGSSPPSARQRFVGLALIAGVVAGVGSALVGEAIASHYRDALFPAIKAQLDPKDVARLTSARLYSAALTFATAGGLLGLALGAAGGLARRSAGASVKIGALGLVLGTGMVGGLSFLAVSNFYARYDHHSDDLFLPLLTQTASWSVVGAIGGLAFGLALGETGRWKATLAGGLVGGLAATVVYEVVGAVVFASSHTDLPLSHSTASRVMAQLLIAVFVAVGAGLALPAGRGSARRSELI
jgi:hypothetical protein